MEAAGGAIFGPVRKLLSTSFVALLAWTTPVAVRAQSDARLLSPGWWGNGALEHLVRAGVVSSLDPLTRPWRRQAVIQALAAVDSEAVAPAAFAAARRLHADLANADSALSIEVFAGLLAASDARRWALRPSRDSSGAFPFGGIRASVRLPHVALVTSPQIDNRLRYDPDYRGKKDRFVAGRNPEAYIAATWPLVDVFFGQIERNWGPGGIEGLVLSPSPYSFDHLQLRIGPRRLRLELIATQLDSRFNIDSTDLRQRFLSLHRLVAQPTRRLTVSLFEAALYADASTERSFEPWYLNPANLFLLSQYDGSETSNALLGADVVYRSRRATLAAQFYVDDFQVDDSLVTDAEPPAYGFTLAIEGGLMRSRAAWQAYYTRVTNLAYRTPASEEAYLLREVGIGRNFADYDQATLNLSYVAGSTLMASAELTWLRQGEGDPRAPYPPESLFASTPTIHSGVVERTVRLAGRFDWWPREGVTVSGELGVNLLDNAGHIAGASRTRWVWRVRAAIRRRWSGVLPQ